MRRGDWFFWLVIGLAGCAVSFVLALLYVQLEQAGGGRVLSTLLERDVLQAIWLSVWVSLTAAALAFLFSLPCGYLLSRFEFPCKSCVEALMVVPVLMSPMALGVSLLLLFKTSLGVWVEENVTRFIFEVPGMILAQFTVALSLETLVVRAAFDSVNPRYEQVARFLGCTRWEAFKWVTFPLAFRGVAAAFVLGWARCMGDFGATSMMAGAIKGKTETMPISIYLSMATVSIDRAVALSMCLTLVTLAALVLVGVLRRSGRVGKERYRVE